MVRKSAYLIGISLVTLALAACGGNDNVDLGPTQWMGTEAHFVMKGVLRGKAVSLDLEGADANDTSKLYCKREYFANGTEGNLDYTTAVPSELKIIYDFVDANGAAQKGEIELKRHDFRSNQKGDQVTAILRDDNVEPPADNFWLEWQSNDPQPKADQYGAQSGTYTHGEYQCTPDATHPELCGAEGTHAANGDVGGFVTGVWSATDHANISFTAHCIQDSVEPNPYP